VGAPVGFPSGCVIHLNGIIERCLVAYQRYNDLPFQNVEKTCYMGKLR
jgi:hypothetical protein